MEQYRTVSSRADGLELDVLEVIPEGEVRGIVQFVHGMQEHKERYLHFMRYLADHGYACLIHDHRGHGKSVRQPEDLGYFYDKEGKAIVEDVFDVVQDLIQRYPHAPVYMVGHSMGSLIVRSYLKKHDDQLDKLIISGAVFNNPSAKAGLNLIKCLSAVKGEHGHSKLVDGMVCGAFDKKIPGDQKNRWLSHNEKNNEAFNNHELDGKPFTLNGYRNLMLLIQDTYSTEGWDVENPSLPVLFLAGEEDPVIGGPQEFEKTVQELRDKGYENVHSKLYPDMRHEILNEINKEVVYQDILNYLDDGTLPKGAH